MMDDQLTPSTNLFKWTIRGVINNLEHFRYFETDIDPQIILNVA